MESERWTLIDVSPSYSTTDLISVVEKNRWESLIGREVYSGNDPAEVLEDAKEGTGSDILTGVKRGSRRPFVLRNSNSSKFIIKKKENLVYTPFKNGSEFKKFIKLQSPVLTKDGSDDFYTVENIEYEGVELVCHSSKSEVDPNTGRMRKIAFSKVEEYNFVDLLFQRFRFRGTLCGKEVTEASK